MAGQPITINEFKFHLAGFSPDSLRAAVVGDAEGVTITLPHSYTVELPEVGIPELTIGKLQIRLTAELVRQLAAALPDESVH